MEQASRTGLLNQRIRPLSKDGRIPFSSSTFDAVVSNQVFEHIADFDMPLARSIE